METTKIRKGNDIRLKILLRLKDSGDALGKKYVIYQTSEPEDTSNTENLSSISSRIYQMSRENNGIEDGTEFYESDFETLPDTSTIYTESGLYYYFEEKPIVETNYASIQSLKAVFVNSTLEEKFKEEFIKKNRFIGRFPIEPFVKEFEPCKYNINSTGRGIYRAFVHNEYCGFGLHPNWKKCAPIRDIDITRYFAPVVSTVDPKVKIVDFPAEALLYEGVYKLVVTAKILDPGYNASERTVTVNYNNIFELVDDSEGATDSAVLLEINNQSEVTPSQDVYVIAGKYDNGSIRLNRNDMNIVDIDVSPLTDWYEGN